MTHEKSRVTMAGVAAKNWPQNAWQPKIPNVTKKFKAKKQQQQQQETVSSK